MKCTYCQSDIEKGTGMMYVYRTGDVAYYCSNGCMKNHISMGRKINRKLVSTPKVAKKEAKAVAKK